MPTEKRRDVVAPPKDPLERKEQELRLSEARLNEAQRIAKIGSWDHDLAEETGWWSDESYRLFGVDPEGFEITREAVLERIHPDDRQRIEDAWRTALQRGEPYALDFRIVLPDGTEKTLHARNFKAFGIDPEEPIAFHRKTARCGRAPQESR